MLRQDALLTGIYRMMAQIVPNPPPDVSDLGREWLADLVMLHVDACRPRPKK